jgi:hypothetical protein
VPAPPGWYFPVHTISRNQLNAQTSTLSLLRRALLLMLLIGVIGIQVELLLLKHTDGVWQLAPLLLNALLIAALAWYGLSHAALPVRALQAVCVLCLVSSGIGVIQHFRANVSYARDSDPSLSGTALYEEAVMGSTPTLAPGAMAQLGLIGLAFAFRHPRIRGAGKDDELKQEE